MALTVTGAAVGDKLAAVIRKACPVQVALVDLLMPASAALFWSVKVHVVLLSVLMSVPLGADMACRQKGTPPLAETDCVWGVTEIDALDRVIVMVAVPLIAPLLAVMVAVPTATPVTFPARDTVAMPSSLVPHSTFPVMSFGGPPWS